MDKELYRCNKVVVRYLAFSSPTCNSSTHAGIPSNDGITPWMSVRLGLEDVSDAGIESYRQDRGHRSHQLVYVSTYVKIIWGYFGDEKVGRHI